MDYLVFSKKSKNKCTESQSQIKPISIKIFDKNHISSFTGIIVTSNIILNSE